MYCYKYPNNINILLDGRSILYISKELNMNREKLSLQLRGIELLTYEEVNILMKKVKPNCSFEDYFDEYNEVEVINFYGKRNKRPYKRRNN